MKPTLAILWIIFLATAATAQTVSVGTTSAQCGAATSVPVTIDNVSGMLSLEFRIAYDPVRLMPTSITAGTLTSGFSISSNPAGGVLRVAMASGSAVSGGGSVATIGFSVAGAATGNVPLTISSVLVNDVSHGGTDGAINITCLAPPAVPVPISPANGATDVAGPVLLQWNAVTSTASYRLFAGTNNPPPQYTITTSTAATFPTEAGTTYYWFVQALNDAGAASGPVWSFRSAGVACTTPAAPRQLQASPEVTSGIAFDLTWQAVSSATRYVVEEANEPTFASPTITNVDSTSLSLTRTSTTSITLYFRVHARNAAAPCAIDGPLSDVVSVRITPRPPLPPGTRILPAVASAAGSLGSFFRTSLQLHNPTSARLSGRLVFHGQGIAGSDGDPFIAYSLAPGQTTSWPDIVTAIGLQSGVGSLDIDPDDHATTPLSVVRVYNDGGSAGTTGSTFEQLGLADAVQAGQRGIVIAPMNPAQTRTNIGIRTLLDGATMVVTVRDKLGAMIQSSRRVYPPTYFVQVPFADFANAVLLGDEVVIFEIESGSAIIYASSTDRVSQDPSIQIARPVR
jgi:hypothetical protein